LDNSLETPPNWKKNKGIKGDLWAVHGGGFYEVAKYQVGPEKMPNNLHWFKWEAYTTWITGSVLMIWMYYMNAQAYLIDPRVMSLTTLQAISLGVGTIVAGVACYELLLRSPLAQKKLLFVASLTLAGGLFFFAFSHFFSGRGAFIHMGALIGSIMVNNVWHKIIPGQRKMVAQVAAGEEVDPAPGLEGKRRSIHNNYLTLPVIFLMISNHYPMIYQHELSWLVALAIMLISAWIRHFFNLKHTGKSKPMVLVSGLAAMMVLALIVSYPAMKVANHNDGPIESLSDQSGTKGTALTKQQLEAVDIISQRCSSCHSSTPTDEVFVVAPSGVVFDNWQDIERWAPRILARSVETADMPFLNKTEMTQAERDRLRLLLK
jgi:uncharacterized membrane protein